MFNKIYKGKKVLVTGHAGFCGSWLCLWLKNLGAEVYGYGHLPRNEPSHYKILNPGSTSLGYDLLGFDWLKETVLSFAPDLIIHLAAKAIVARTFTEPRETFENNVMGAVNILEVARLCPSIKGIVMITTDKVYEDKEWDWGYRENDELGGSLPYDASKVCVEQVIRCYRDCFGVNIATARAGNVIGGGDWSEGRLIPDIVRATVKGEKVVVHTPDATRPWQHVLEPLSGYLMLGQAMLEGRDVNGEWNFGPDGDAMTVLDILKTAKNYWREVDWEVDSKPTHPGMVYLLRIDNTKAKKELGWHPALNMWIAVKNTILWYKSWYEVGIVCSGSDITDYQFRMKKERGV